MNNPNSEQPNITDDEMLPEYDFTGGVRGKHYQAYRQGHAVAIHQIDGKDIVQYFTLEDGEIMLVGMKIRFLGVPVAVTKLSATLYITPQHGINRVSILGALLSKPCHHIRI